MTGYPKTGRYAKLQSAETVLGVLRDRGRRGLPCNELFRQLFNPQIYLLAYGRLYSNHGAMTPGALCKTSDIASSRIDAQNVQEADGTPHQIMGNGFSDR